MKFKIGDRVVIKSYSQELYNVLGSVSDGAELIGKSGTVTDYYRENEEQEVPDGFRVKFDVKNNEDDYDWYFVESDIQLISEYGKVIPASAQEKEVVLIDINDFNFLLNEFNLDTTNGAKYTRLLKHFAGKQ